MQRSETVNGFAAYLIPDLGFFDAGRESLLDAVEKEGQLFKWSSKVLSDVRLQGVVVLLLCVLPQAFQRSYFHSESYLQMRQF